jgi:hypothetical protein
MLGKQLPQITEEMCNRKMFVPAPKRIRPKASLMDELVAKVAFMKIKDNFTNIKVKDNSVLPEKGTTIQEFKSCSPDEQEESFPEKIISDKIIVKSLDLTSCYLWYCEGPACKYAHELKTKHRSLLVAFCSYHHGWLLSAGAPTMQKLLDTFQFKDIKSSSGSKV